MTINLNEYNLETGSIRGVAGSEASNLRQSFKLLKEDLKYVSRVKWLYCNIADEVNDQQLIPLRFYHDAGNAFLFSVLSAMRVHFVEAFAITRRAIESAAYAYKAQDPEVASTWLKKTPKDNIYRQELFEGKFPADHEVLSELKTRWEIACNFGSHASFLSQVHRFGMKGSKSTAGYFDIDDPEEFPANITRNFHWILGTHLLCIRVFHEVLRACANPGWVEALGQFREDYSKFLDTVVRAKLKHVPPEQVTPEPTITDAGIYIPKAGEILGVIDLLNRNSLH